MVSKRSGHLTAVGERMRREGQLGMKAMAWDKLLSCSPSVSWSVKGGTPALCCGWAGEGINKPFLACQGSGIVSWGTEWPVWMDDRKGVPEGATSFLMFSTHCTHTLWHAQKLPVVTSLHPRPGGSLSGSGMHSLCPQNLAQ